MNAKKVMVTSSSVSFGDFINQESETVARLNAGLLRIFSRQIGRFTRVLAKVKNFFSFVAVCIRGI